jgi:hypothetical protein
MDGEGAEGFCDRFRKRRRQSMPPFEDSETGKPILGRVRVSNHAEQISSGSQKRAWAVVELPLGSQSLEDKRRNSPRHRLMQLLSAGSE